MKKTMFIAAFAVAAMAMLSCNKNELMTVTEEALVPMTFTASAGDTKTVINNGTSVLWQAGDEIGISDGTGGSGVKGVKFTNSAAGATGVFSGSMEEMDNYYAAAPYSAINHWTAASPNVYLTVPTVQIATKGSFDPAAGLMVGTANNTDRNFTFHHVLGYIKFTIGENSGSIKSVTLTSGVGMACNLKVDATAAADNVKGSKDGSDIFSITLKTADDSAMEPGDYYIGLRARKYTGGITVTFTATDDKIAEANIPEKTVASATAYNIGEVKGLDFVSSDRPVAPELGTIEGNGIVAFIGLDHYLLLSLEEGTSKAWSTDVSTQMGCSSADGAVNTATITSRSDYSATKFPAFAWAVSQGEGWYLPTNTEMSNIFGATMNSADAIATFNNKISAAGGTPVTVGTYHWGSAEVASSGTYSNAQVYRLNADGTVSSSNYKRNGTTNRLQRAVKKVML